MYVFKLQHSHFSDFGPETKIWNSNMDHLEQLLLKAFCSPMKFFFNFRYIQCKFHLQIRQPFLHRISQKKKLGGFQPHMKRLITRHLYQHEKNQISQVSNVHAEFRQNYIHAQTFNNQFNTLLKQLEFRKHFYTILKIA